MDEQQASHAMNADACRYCLGARLVGWSGAGPILCPECSRGEDAFTVITQAWSEQRKLVFELSSLVDSLRLGCEIAYRRYPTQAEGDAHEYRQDQSMGASYGIGESFVPMGGHHGWKCRCGTWVWGGPTVCQRCVDAAAVQVAIEDAKSLKAELAELEAILHAERDHAQQQGLERFERLESELALLRDDHEANGQILRRAAELLGVDHFGEVVGAIERLFARARTED